MSPSSLRKLQPLVGPAAILAVLVVVVCLNATAWEVVSDSAKKVFAIFGTPFILEAAVIVIMLWGVIIYNRWRIKKEGDGWVYMTVTEDDGDGGHATTPASHSLPPAREVSSSILEHMKAGRADKAMEVFQRHYTVGDPASRLLEIKLRAANRETENARKLLQQTLVEAPGSWKEISAELQETAEWLDEHVRQEDLSDVWLREAHRIHPPA